jgi:hypothetical protein
MWKIKVHKNIYIGNLTGIDHSGDQGVDGG